MTCLVPQVPRRWNTEAKRANDAERKLAAARAMLGRCAADMENIIGWMRKYHPDAAMDTAHFQGSMTAARAEAGKGA